MTIEFTSKCSPCGKLFYWKNFVFFQDHTAAYWQVQELPSFTVSSVKRISDCEENGADAIQETDHVYMVDIKSPTSGGVKPDRNCPQHK